MKKKKFLLSLFERKMGIPLEKPTGTLWWASLVGEIEKEMLM